MRGKIDWPDEHFQPEIALEVLKLIVRDCRTTACLVTLCTKLVHVGLKLVSPALCSRFSVDSLSQSGLVAYVHGVCFLS